MFLFSCHSQRSQSEGPVVESQLKGDVHHVEKQLFADEFDFHFFVVEMSSHFSDLSHRVINKSPSLAAIVKCQALFGLILANKTGRPHAWVRKLQVLVKIIETIKKIAHVAAQNW